MINKSLKVIIAAAGFGRRMQSSQPKPFIKIHNKAILLWTIEKFIAFHPNIDIILVAHTDFIEQTHTLIKAMNYPFIQIIEGGETRFHSVRNAVSYVNKGDIVFVHDAARCLVSPALIATCYAYAKIYENAIPATPLKDSVRQVKGLHNYALDRATLRSIQTPQTFKGELLIEAFKQPYQSLFTDEASLVEAMHVPITLIDGEETNIKITYPQDIILAQYLLSTL